MLIPELLFTIFKYLEPKELLPISLVCNEFNSISNSIFSDKTKPLVDEAVNFESIVKLDSQKMTFFNATKEIDEKAAKLLEIISDDSRLYVAYEPFLDQTGLNSILGSECFFTKKIVELFLSKYNVNVSNNYGMTLLHYLVLYERFDLAEMVIKNPDFTKINYKFHLPHGGNIYASALDWSLTLWIGKNDKVDLKFIELLLQYGAKPPTPGEKFISSELVYNFFPAICSIENYQSPENMINLIYLLNRYNFSIELMENDLKESLSSERVTTQFEEEFSINANQQKIILDEFITTLRMQLDQQTEPHFLVSQVGSRMDNGKSTIKLPYDPTNNCSIM
ncbi:MAG: F-box protein [Legionella sp.]|nr:F-box protein [Legionella sp.]